MLDVNDNENLWRIYIKDLPKTWFHFAFTWLRHQRVMSLNEGLRVYIDGELKLESLSPRLLGNVFDNSRIIISERDLNKITFGKVGSLEDFRQAGKFQLGHLAIWKRALGADEIKRVYTINVGYSSKNRFLCDNKWIKCKECLSVWITFFSESCSAYNLINLEVTVLTIAFSE